MNSNELIIDNIYTCIYRGRKYIFKYSGDVGIGVKHIDIRRCSYYNNGWNFYAESSAKNTIQKPTNIEIKWMLNCIKEDRFVECPKSANIEIHKLKLD